LAAAHGLAGLLSHSPACIHKNKLHFRDTRRLRLPWTLDKVIRGFATCACSPICRRRGCRHAHDLPLHWTAAPASEALHDCAQETSAPRRQLVRRLPAAAAADPSGGSFDLEKRCPTDTNMTSTTSFARAWWMRTWSAPWIPPRRITVVVVTAKASLPSRPCSRQGMCAVDSPRYGFNVDGTPFELWASTTRSWSLSTSSCLSRLAE
jgi:hypothetical protein